MEKTSNVLDGKNPFFRPTKGMPIGTTTNDTEDDKYIIEQALVDKVVKTGEGDEDFIVKHVVTVISKVDRADYINSHREDVGILNIIKKVQLSGDVDLKNSLISKQGYNDITQLPEDKIDAMKAVESGVHAFDDLPEEIKGKMSLSQFATQNEEDYQKLIDDIAKKLKAQSQVENKEGVE